MPKLEKDSSGLLLFDCPGCGMSHYVQVEDGKSPRWSWNGSMEKPTFSPSILVRWEYGPNYEKRVCHSFVTDGRIQFLGDCTHKLSGQTVELPEIS